MVNKTGDNIQDHPCAFWVWDGHAWTFRELIDVIAIYDSNLRPPPVPRASIPLTESYLRHHNHVSLNTSAESEESRETTNSVVSASSAASACAFKQESINISRPQGIRERAASDAGSAWSALSDMIARVTGKDQEGPRVISRRDSIGSVATEKLMHEQ